jgi:hypothetical protein
MESSFSREKVPILKKMQYIECYLLPLLFGFDFPSLGIGGYIRVYITL